MQRVQAAHCGSGGSPRFAAAGHADALLTLVEVLEQEAEDRRQRRIIRLRRASKLPVGKTWTPSSTTGCRWRSDSSSANWSMGASWSVESTSWPSGLPGTGKTHAMCAIGHRLVESGRSVLFTPAYRLVQNMAGGQAGPRSPTHAPQARQLRLPFSSTDLGYLPQGTDESEVLFTLIAERYERRSLGITSNLVFSQWDKVFDNLWPRQRP